MPYSCVEEAGRSTRRTESAGASANRVFKSAGRVSCPSNPAIEKIPNNSLIATISLADDVAESHGTRGSDLRTRRYAAQRAADHLRQRESRYHRAQGHARVGPGAVRCSGRLASPGQVESLCHEDGFTPGRSDGRLLRNDKAETLVEPDGASGYKRNHLRAPGVLRKPLRQLEECTSMTAPLNISADSNATKRRDITVDINSDDANVLSPVNQELRVIVRSPIIRMIRVVNAESPTCFKQHFAANSVKAVPLTF